MSTASDSDEAQVEEQSDEQEGSHVRAVVSSVRMRTCISSFRRQSRFLASGRQSLPTYEGGFREAEPSYDEAHPLCDLGW